MLNFDSLRLHCRKRISADQSLKHPWLQQLGSTHKKSSLNAAKQNLTSNRDHWDESNQREFIFDRPSKTISVAVETSNEPETPETPEADLEAEQGEKMLSVPGPLATSTSTDSVKSNGSAVITLDQIRRKAEEICERKRVVSR